MSTSLKPVATIELVNERIHVLGSEQTVMKLLDVTFDFPTMKKVEIENAVVKKVPEDLGDNLFLTLKQNISHPYYVSRKPQVVERPK